MSIDHNCKIDKHEPTEDGSACSCGYFTKARPNPHVAPAPIESKATYDLDTLEHRIRKIHVLAMSNLHLGRDESVNPVWSIEGLALDLLEFIDTARRYRPLTAKPSPKSPQSQPTKRKAK